MTDKYGMALLLLWRKPGVLPAPIGGQFYPLGRSTVEYCVVAPLISQ